MVALSTMSELRGGHVTRAVDIGERVPIPLRGELPGPLSLELPWLLSCHVQVAAGGHRQRGRNKNQERRREVQRGHVSPETLFDIFSNACP